VKTPERDLADYAYGNGWGRYMERRLEKIEGDNAQFRADRQKLDDINNGVKKLGTEWVAFLESDKKKFTRFEKRIEALENEQFDDEEEITGVQSVDKLQRNARGQRARVRRWKRNAKVIGPMLVGVGAGLVELVRAIIHMSGK
jgi:hypothetical protein